MKKKKRKAVLTEGPLDDACHGQRGWGTMVMGTMMTKSPSRDADDGAGDVT